MPSSNSALGTVALFCKVVDNFGDVGICWRLSRQLQHEHGIAVTLYVDDLQSFRRICPAVVTTAAVQRVAGVTVRHWAAQPAVFRVHEIADIVIEFFGCDIPDDYIAAMAAATPQPIWLNLEGLSAESWVEGCHGLPSPHPRLPLTKYFFFPGFNDKTGGLLREATLQQEREQFQADKPAMQAFLARLGVPAHEAASFKVSMFCYPHAPAAALFSAWQAGEQAVTCLVPEGVAAPAIAEFFDEVAVVGATRTCGALTVRIVPFVAQTDYDRLLWACDLNFVRGEDSFVRAQWAGKPFIWHIYPQDKNLHHVKLRAFLQRHAPESESLETATLCWNDVQPDDNDPVLAWPEIWQRMQAELPGMAGAAVQWERQLLANGDLVSNLLRFATKIRQRCAP